MSNIEALNRSGVAASLVRTTEEMRRTGHYAIDHAAEHVIPVLERAVRKAHDVTEPRMRISRAPAWRAAG